MTLTPKPCPFCGSENLKTSGHYWYTGCLDCGAEGPIATTEEASIEKWNTRPIEAELREALKPFAEIGERWGDTRSDSTPVWITFGLLRAAARAVMHSSAKNYNVR